MERDCGEWLRTELHKKKRRTIQIPLEVDTTQPPFYAKNRCWSLEFMNPLGLQNVQYVLQQFYSCRIRLPGNFAKQMIDVWICWIYLHLDFAAIFRETDPPNAIHQNLKLFLVNGLHPKGPSIAFHHQFVNQLINQTNRGRLFGYFFTTRHWKWWKNAKIPASKASFSSSMDDELIPQWDEKDVGCLESSYGFQHVHFSSRTPLGTQALHRLVEMGWLSDTAQLYSDLA